MHSKDFLNLKKNRLTPTKKKRSCVKKTYYFTLTGFRLFHLMERKKYGKLLKLKSIPVIRHTKTSLRRMQNANPLLETCSDVGAQTEWNHARCSQDKNKHFLHRRSRSHEEKKTSIFVCKLPQPQEDVNAQDIKSSPDVQIAFKTPTSYKRHSIFTPETIKKNPQNKNKHFIHRRSRSHEEKKTSISVCRLAQPQEFVNAQDIKSSPDVQIAFQTPTSYKRSSIFTPETIKKNQFLWSSTPVPEYPQSLELNLTEWLKQMNKDLSVHHLKYFGQSHQHMDPRSETCKNFLSINTYQLNHLNEVNIDNIEVHKIAKEALSELHTLIREGYLTEECLAWLDLIRDKHKETDEEPEYWECRAAIEQIAGNISGAIECYKTAILQGAEVNNIDKSLDELLRKFSLLSPGASKCHKRQNILLQARNIFKSSIIQLAVEQRNLIKSKGPEVGT